MKINIKPLSVNQVWQGRRFKTQKYKDYEEEVMLLLPTTGKFYNGKLEIELTFGMSSKLADIDNPIKPFLDILQKRYGFNDKQIYKLNVKKVNVKKKEEYIDFTIKTTDP